MAKEGALVRVESGYPVLSHAHEIMDVIEANLGGEQISPRDLVVAKVPGGGSMSWQLSGDEEVKEIEGIILYHTLKRGKWDGTIEETGGGQPPVCSSEDGRTGFGDPGGDCLTCPFKEFGPEGERPPCKLRRLVFIVREGEYLPIAVSLPAMSLDASKAYLMRLVTKGIKIHGVVTKMTLEAATNKAGIRFARAKFTQGDALSQEAIEQVELYAEKLVPVLKQVRIEHTGAAQEVAA